MTYGQRHDRLADYGSGMKPNTVRGSELIIAQRDASKLLKEEINLNSWYGSKCMAVWRTTVSGALAPTVRGDGREDGRTEQKAHYARNASERKCDTAMENIST